MENLHLRIRQFEGEAHILNGVNLHLRAGERVALVGESGCGKSSTAMMSLGLMEARSMRAEGRIILDGTDLLSLRRRGWQGVRGRQISMIFQDPGAALNPVFTVGDQLVTAIRRGNPSKSRSDAQGLATDGLRQVHINDPERVMSSYPFQLSGGLNQRVLITMALINRPKVVVADEPGSALDVTVQEQTLRLMTELCADVDAAVLLISHNLGVVRRFAQRIYVMYSGTIVEEADTATLFSAPRHPYTKALLAAVPRLTGERLPEPIPGRVPDYTDPPVGCRFRPRCPHQRSECVDPPFAEPAPGHRVRCVL
ncbi:MAG: ABC transporter ATP-binding protein [Rubellimicrobium sp.]|nr:ABC transporter ATP-binding protein [Rubellimicrobium sp.]